MTNDPNLLTVPAEVRAVFQPILAALPAARRSLASTQNVLNVRPGYEYPDAGKPIPAIVVAMTPSAPRPDVDRLATQLGVPVGLIDATVEEQLSAQLRTGPVSFAPADQSAVSFAGAEPPVAGAFEALLTGEEVAFGPPKEGAYQPLNPPDLPLIDEPMKLTICVSPEAGWSELESFLKGTTESLTVAMYQFTAPHIFAAVRDAVSPAGRKFELVLHPRPEKPPKSGVKAEDLNEQTDVLEPLDGRLKKRFLFSWATLVSKANPEGLWASAYHIKVAVRDGSSVWLSSGNWQSSNQPDVHPFEEGHDALPKQFQRKYNRDYHAIIENERLAEIYETYIKRDHDLSAAQGQPEDFSAPDLFVPEEAEEEAEVFAAPPQFFPPLRLEGSIKAQPLLTPDNYSENALALIQSAKKSVWFQNQYINFRGTNDDFNDFRLLVLALKDKIDAGLEVRIICRDMMKQESVDVLVALGFPREVMRFQPACHNKTIIVDGEIVMFGSHNWSNEGVKSNRDASMIFYDQRIAQYLSQVYDYDWNRLATAKPTASRPRVARDGEPTPRGQRRAQFSEVFED
jgi:PLD-like domain